MDRAIIVHLLRAMAEAIENQDEAQLAAFAKAIQRKKVPVVTSALRAALGSRAAFGSKERPKLKNSRKIVGIEILEDVLRQLQESSSRGAGSEVLERARLTRDELAMLARLASLHVSKDDGIQKIKEKLVESVIGSKLNSRAIRGD